MTFLDHSSFENGSPTLDELIKFRYLNNYLGLQSNSFDGQDNYVIDMLRGKRNGFFVDVGAGSPSLASNTYALEKHLNWSGILIERHPVKRRELIKHRNSYVFETGVCKKDNQNGFKTLEYILKKYSTPRIINYLSIDIDGSDDNEFDIIENFPFDLYVFQIITIEHDLYKKDNQKKRNDIYNLLIKNRYVYDCTISVDDCYIHSSIYDSIRLNRNNKFYWKLDFKL